MLTLSSAGPILAFASIESLKAGPKLPGLAWLPFLSFAVGQIYGACGAPSFCIRAQWRDLLARRDADTDQASASPSQSS